MATFANDTFTDTNGVTLQSHTPDDGGSWTRVGGTRDCEIRGNRVKRLASGGSSTGAVIYTHSGTPATAEYDVQCDYWQDTDVNNPCGLMARVVIANPDYYELLYSAATDTLTFNKNVGGTTTQLGQDTAISLSNGSSFTARFECKDATKKVFINGTENTAFATSDNAITAAGSAGIRFPIGTQTNSTAVSLDNFSATDISSGVTLTVQEATHALPTDNVDLTQENTLSVADALHALPTDNVALTQANNLVVQETLHSHLADNVVLTQANTIVVQETLHAHTVDNVALTQANVLAVQEALHAHIVDNVVLDFSSTLSVADATHAHLADNVALVQANILVVQETAHTHAVDNIVLTQQNTLVVQESLHAHSADSPVLAFTAFLVVQETSHGHTVDNLTLSQILTLVVNDAWHGHFSDLISIPTPGLVPLKILSITFAFHKTLDREMALIKRHPIEFAFIKEREQGFVF